MLCAMYLLDFLLITCGLALFFSFNFNSKPPCFFIKTGFACHSYYFCRLHTPLCLLNCNLNSSRLKFHAVNIGCLQSDDKIVFSDYATWRGYFSIWFSPSLWTNIFKIAYLLQELMFRGEFFLHYKRTRKVSLLIFFNQCKFVCLSNFLPVLHVTAWPTKD